MRNKAKGKMEISLNLAGELPVASDELMPAFIPSDLFHLFFVVHQSATRHSWAVSGEAFPFTED